MSRFLTARNCHLEPYDAGEEPQSKNMVLLNTNELPYPPSTAAWDRINRELVDGLNRYGDPTAFPLRTGLARIYGVKPDQVVMGNGSDEILGLAMRAFGSPEPGIAFPDITYCFYSGLASSADLKVTNFPLDADFRISPRDYREFPGLIVIANPNAPTGLIMPLAQIEDIADGRPERILIIDEAYIDFSGQASAVTLLPRCPNLLVTGTFSKSRGMAGARLGFAIGSEELIDDLNRVRGSMTPYNIDNLTMAIGAAVLDDPDYLKQCIQRIQKTREEGRKRLCGLGFLVTRSCTNFLFVCHPKLNAGLCAAALRERGIVVRHFSEPQRIDPWLRITVGTEEQMEQLYQALEQILNNEEARQ